MNPLLSVIVPAYRIEKYLGPCLESIIEQTYRPIEIIVVDDGSPDASGEVADCYADKYPDMVTCIHIPNSGVTNARLTGVKAAKGKWIGFVDGDDAIEPDMYERLMKNAYSFNADISHCGYQTIVNNGERTHLFYGTGRTIIRDHDMGLSDLVEGEFIEPSLWNKLFRRELFNEILKSDAFDTSIRYNEDLLMNFMLFDKAECSVFEDFCPYLYMARDSSVTRGIFRIEKITDPIQVTKWITDHCSAEVKDAARRRYLRAVYNGYTELLKIDSNVEQKKELRKLLLDHRKWWKVIRNREKLKLYMMIYIPRIFISLYQIYEKKYQKKVYE